MSIQTNYSIQYTFNMIWYMWNPQTLHFKSVVIMDGDINNNKVKKEKLKCKNT